ncbi:uncharacterized protein [Miscanthus floridulus]|uniref:uncharacterized protein n=1 Tax=Miscanthus floridulus TaxID=154761 RepID=UPI0034591D26
MVALKLWNLCFVVVLSSMAISCCRGQGGGGGAGAGAGGAGGAAGGGAGGAAGGAVVPGTQDAIQIVSQAALCFDNRQVINGCLQAMGINVNGSGASGNGNGGSSNGSGGSGGRSNGNSGSTAIMCQGPCFGQMMLMMTCVNGILGNIQGYSPGLMQGVQAVFQMSCGNVGNSQQGGGGSGGAAGGGGGGGAAGATGVGGAGGAGGAGGGGTSGASGGVAGGAGNAVGASGGSNTANSANTAGGSTNPNGGSHMAVSNLDELTSSADGPMASFTSRFPSMLRTWACIWLLRLLWL